MATQQIKTHQFANGLTLVAQPMSWLESAAFTLLVPAGCRHDPAERQGLANFVSEMIQRGCGARDSRQYVEDLELLGADTSASVSNAHLSVSGAMPAETLFETLAIHADLVRQPHFPEDQLEDGRQVCLHEIRASDDDPAQRTMLELRRRHYADPFGRPSQGEADDVAQVTNEEIRTFWSRHVGPRDAILSVAGRVDWDQLQAHVERLFADWQPQDVSPIEEQSPPRGYLHQPHESSQTHLGVAYSSVPYPHPDYFQARGAVGVLSDGMSSRLFTEVREKRGLCYTVQATCHSLRDRGSVICYAGTTTERAQETLDVLMAELVRLSDGVDAAELDRLKARIKSGLIMQQESSTARSGAIAADWYFLGRVRTLDELGTILDELSCDSINRYLAAHPPTEFAVVTLGSEELEMPSGVL